MVSTYYQLSKEDFQHLILSTCLTTRIPSLTRTLSLLVMLLLLGGTGQPAWSQTKQEIERTEIDNLQNYYASLDPTYRNLLLKLPEVRTVLENLQRRVAAVQPSEQGEIRIKVSNCLEAIGKALARTRSAIQLTEIPQYGTVMALLRPAKGEEADENRLAKVLACLTDLKAVLIAEPEITQDAARLKDLSDFLNEEFGQIDQAKAKRSARSALRRVQAEKPTGSGANPKPGPCEYIDFEQANYWIRDIRIDDPFSFLPWIKKREEDAATQIRTLVKGQRFTYNQAAAKALEIIENVNFLPDTSDKRVKLRLEIVRVENCAEGQLDLAYGVFSTQIMPVLSAPPESRVNERRLPQTAAGQTTILPASQATGQAAVAVPAPKRVRFTPLGGYDLTNRLSGGGRLEITPNSFRKFPLSSIVLQGQASSDMHYVSAALAGAADFSAESTDASKWLAHAEWLLDFTHFALPTGVGQIKGGHLSAQFSGVTKPIGKGNFIFRFGGLLAGGNSQSDVGSVILPADTVPSDGFGTVKVYAGLDSRLRNHVLSASYGLELGSIGPTTRIDWRKQILDVRHEFWKSLVNHKILDLESRFTLGSIQVPGKIPLPERFFGGNNEELFITGDTWEIRANPVIRAIPASKFFRTRDGAGSEHFFSYNFTAAYAVWRKTLVPQDLTDDPEFKSEVQGAITTVTSTLQNYFASKDPHFSTVVAKLPQTQTDLNSLKIIVLASKESHPNQDPDLFSRCIKAVSGAIRRTTSAIKPEGGDQFGLITFLLSEDPDEIQLDKVRQECGSESDLNKAINDSTITAATARVTADRQFMVSEFNQIDQDQAAKKASDEMAFTRRTLGTLFNDVNIYSISPVLVLDVARIGVSSGGVGGVRYGPGMGLRLELASVAHFTAGYAWNVKQGIGEGRGNVFVSIGIRDLFR